MSSLRRQFLRVSRQFFTLSSLHRQFLSVKSSVGSFIGVSLPSTFRSISCQCLSLTFSQQFRSEGCVKFPLSPSLSVSTQYVPRSQCLCMRLVSCCLTSLCACV